MHGGEGCMGRDRSGGGDDEIKPELGMTWDVMRSSVIVADRVAEQHRGIVALPAVISTERA